MRVLPDSFCGGGGKAMAAGWNVHAWFNLMTDAKFTDLLRRTAEAGCRYDSAIADFQASGAEPA